MSDAALREVERALLTAPDSLELRRQHARVLGRVGREDEALAAMDLAWRLGAEELWDDLRTALKARRIEVGGLTLCFVPGGPFVMGSEDYDDDCAPPHLVELSPFYVAQGPLMWTSLESWEEFPEYWRRGDRRWWTDIPFQMGHPDKFTVSGAMAHLTAAATPAGLQGEYGLIREAEWERVFRAGYLRADREGPYGVQRASSQRLEWAADLYDASYYAESPRRDPTGPLRGELRVVRGVHKIPDPQFAVYREAAREPDGAFGVGPEFPTKHWARHEEGIVVRPVFRLES